MLIVIANQAFAQTNTKAILTGKVTDAASGDVLIGLVVTLDGTKSGGKTKLDGTYRIKDIVPGTYKVVFNYLGYKKRELANITLSPGETKTLNVEMESSSVTTGTVNVVAERTNDNEAAILTQRKNASQVSDGISNEEIKKFSDADAGQSLKRVSGVTLMNDKFVYVRGVSERYSNTTLNGTTLSSTEPDKKSFAFDMFPSEFLENANVAKSFTPDMPGNFAGGLVQLNTVNFPSESSFKLSFSTSASDNVTFKSNAFSMSNDAQNNYFGFDNSRNLPGSTPSSNYEMTKLVNSSTNFGDPEKTDSRSNEWLSLSKSYSGDSWKRQATTASPNLGMVASYSNIIDLDGDDLGIIASAMYNNSYSRLDLQRKTLNVDPEVVNPFSFEGTGTQTTFSTNLGSMLNFAYRIGANNTISFKNTYNNSSDDEIVSMKGNKYSQSQEVIQLSSQYVQKSLYSGQFGGDHTFQVMNNLNSILDWKIGYSASERNEPDFKRIRYSRTIGNEENFIADVSALKQGAGSQSGRLFTNLLEGTWSGGLNFMMPISEKLKVKLGGYYETRDRDFLVRSMTLVQSKAIIKTVYNSELGYNEKNTLDPTIAEKLYLNGTDKISLSQIDVNTIDPSVIFASQNIGINGFGYSEDTQDYYSYKASEKLAAAYAMTDYQFDLFETKSRVIAGLRVENSNQKMDSYFPYTSNVDGKDISFDSNYVDRSYFDVLPSLNLVFELNKETNLRLSASQTLTRPSLREYAPFTFYDFLTQSNVQGNVNLKRALIQNYDLRYETFPNIGEVFSAGLFYKIFDNAIEETISPTQSEPKRSYDNAKGLAYNYGLEIEARKSLSFISESLSNFALNLNASYINSEITVTQNNKTETRAMWGQSPYTVNLGIFYTNIESGTSVNLGLNTIGKRIIQVADINVYPQSNPHIYELPRQVVDLSISQVLFEKLNVKFAAKDLLNQKIEWEQLGKKVSTNIKGSGYSLSFAYKF